MVLAVAEGNIPLGADYPATVHSQCRKSCVLRIDSALGEETAPRRGFFSRQNLDDVGQQADTCCTAHSPLNDQLAQKVTDRAQVRLPDLQARLSRSEKAISPSDRNGRVGARAPSPLLQVRASSTGSKVRRPVPPKVVDWIGQLARPIQRVLARVAA
jgi:hypothetical protein